MNIWKKLTQAGAIESVQHLHKVRIDIEKTPIELKTRGYGLLVIRDVTAIGHKRLVKYLSPEKTTHELLLTKGSTASLKLYSLAGRQKINVSVGAKNLDLTFTHPRMLHATELPLGMRGEPNKGQAYSYRLHAQKMKAQVSAYGMRQQLIQSFRIHCATISARKMEIFRARVPAQRAQVRIPSVRTGISIPSFQEHLKRQNFDFKFMSLMTKKEVS